MQQNFEDYKNETIDSCEEDLAEENNSGITGHPILSMIANLFLNR